MSETTDEAKALILSDFWLGYKDDEGFSDFIQYNDLGLPLSYATTTGIVKPTEKSTELINETFQLLLEAMEIEDEGFESLDDLTFRFGK